VRSDDRIALKILDILKEYSSIVRKSTEAVKRFFIVPVPPISPIRNRPCLRYPWVHVCSLFIFPPFWLYSSYYSTEYRVYASKLKKVSKSINMYVHVTKLNAESSELGGGRRSTDKLVRLSSNDNPNTHVEDFLDWPNPTPYPRCYPWIQTCSGILGLSHHS
jgi:hypothetical protein